ncbi:MAG TPA: MAPEG family protein [Rhizomicrobium sp.]|nr:MAPEG family protein [Rhizomicrobium sp.]
MQDQILLPMGALALLTFIVLLFIPVRRFRAAFAGKVTAEDFKFGESERVPGHVSLANRNYMNLTELPVLFYVACLMFYVTNRVDQNVIWIAWAYVALRVLHSLIHITYNNVIHRLSVFAISNFVLIWMWVMFFVKAA